MAVGELIYVVYLTVTGHDVKCGVFVCGDTNGICYAVEERDVCFKSVEFAAPSDVFSDRAKAEKKAMRLRQKRKKI